MYIKYQYTSPPLHPPVGSYILAPFFFFFFFGTMCRVSLEEKKRCTRFVDHNTAWPSSNYLSSPPYVYTRPCHFGNINPPRHSTQTYDYGRVHTSSYQYSSQYTRTHAYGRTYIYTHSHSQGGVSFPSSAVAIIIPKHLMPVERGVDMDAHPPGL